MEVDATPGGDWLLAGDVAIEVTLADGSTLHARLDLPPGAPDRPPSQAELAAKVADCAGDQADEILAVDWSSALVPRERLPARSLREQRCAAQNSIIERRESAPAAVVPRGPDSSNTKTRTGSRAARL